jgi:DNA-binding NtrC family response regulator
VNTGRVLLVCDDLRGFPSYGGILSALGYDVVMCSSYEEGARRVEMEDFDFAIVGQGSASFEGRCVLERAAEVHRNIPIVVVARCLDIHCYLEAMDLGAVDYLERPEPDDLGWVMETQLRRRDAA